MSDDRSLGSPGRYHDGTPLKTAKDAFVALPRVGDLARSEQAEQVDRESSEFERRFPLYARKAREDRERVAAVERGQVVDAFYKRHGRFPTAAELQDNG